MKRGLGERKKLLLAWRTRAYMVDSFFRSRSGSRKAKMTHRNRKKERNFKFWSAGCTLLMAEGFSCNFWSRKYYFFFSCHFVSILVFKVLDLDLYPRQDPDPHWSKMPARIRTETNADTKHWYGRRVRKVYCAHACILRMRTACAWVRLRHAYFLRMRTSCACVLLAHCTYCLRVAKDWCLERGKPVEVRMLGQEVQLRENGLLQGEDEAPVLAHRAQPPRPRPAHIGKM